MAIPTIQPLSSLADKDKAYVWHPFTQAYTDPAPLPIVIGKGAILYSEEGNSYLDGISSWWVNLHGHAHPYIVEKIHQQAERLEHLIFAGFTHPPAVELASRLLSLLPGEMGKIFYSDNGSTAVEAAVKIALQYWQNKDAKTEKTRVICFKGGYHGDTFGAMSAAGKHPLHQPFWSHLFHADAIDLPLPGNEEHSVGQLKELLFQGKSACFIFEPLVLGSSGMLLYPAEPLNELLRLCREAGVLTIADEVMTGFGRLGTLFACQQLSAAPDMICLSKGLTGGFLPLGATACTERIYQAFLDQRHDRAFLHGHSYTGNPLACASALASLDLLEQNESLIQRKLIEERQRQFSERWRGHPKLKRCESIGTLLVVEYATEGSSSYFLKDFRDKLICFFLEAGIVLRPLGNVLYLMPPYCITEAELTYIHSKIIDTLEAGL